MSDTPSPALSIPEGVTDRQLALILAHYLCATKIVRQSYLFDKARENFRFLQGR
jgi:hypothetical protein